MDAFGPLQQFNLYKTTKDDDSIPYARFKRANDVAGLIS
jgi:hypothetical protein